MKVRLQSLAWAAFLLLAGLFLLLKNLGVFGVWGEAAWGGLFALAGLSFLVWFVVDRARWWRAIPGFTLASIGAELLLSWRGIDLGGWRGALVMFGVALGFWTVLIVHRDNWWAEIPAGILTVLGVLSGFQARLSALGWLALFFVGLGFVFALLYFARFGQTDTHWAGIPAAGLLLLGAATLFNAFTVAPVIAHWWPILLVVAGAGLAIGSFTGTAAPKPTIPAEDLEAASPAAGTSVSATLPEAARMPEKTGRSTPAASVQEPVKPAVAPARAEGPVDIYNVLAQQPRDDKPTQ